MAVDSSYCQNYFYYGKGIVTVRYRQEKTQTTTWILIIYSCYRLWIMLTIIESRSLKIYNVLDNKYKLFIHNTKTFKKLYCLQSNYLIHITGYYYYSIITIQQTKSFNIKPIHKIFQQLDLKYSKLFSTEKITKLFSN